MGPKRCTAEEVRIEFKQRDFAFDLQEHVSISKATEILVVKRHSKRHLNETASHFCIIMYFLMSHALSRSNICSDSDLFLLDYLLDSANY